MRTYDQAAGSPGTRPFLKSLRGWLRRAFDRERELISLRNAVGMMSEARRNDAAEWHAMYEGSKVAREDSRRLRWLTEDYADGAQRQRVLSIIDGMKTRSYSAVCRDIDRAMQETAANRSAHV